MSQASFSGWIMKILFQRTDPATYYREALDLARRIQDPEEEYALLLALAEVQIHDDGEAAMACYQDALKKARDLGDPKKELPCLGGLIKALGFSDADAVARYKDKAQDILVRLGTLETYHLRAYLVDDLYCIPRVLARGERYRLIITLGEVPAGSLRLFSEPPASEITPHTELIYTLGAPAAKTKREDTGGECLEVKPGLRMPAEVFISQPEAVVGGSIPKFEVKPDVEFEAGLPAEAFLLPAGRPDLREGEAGPDEGMTTPRPEEGASFDLDVSLKGIGLECEETNFLKKCLCQEDCLLFSTWVTPLEGDIGSVDVKILADGIPYRLPVRYLIQESRGGGVLSEGSGAATSRIREISDRLNELFEVTFPARASGANVFMEAAAGLKELAAQLPLDVYAEIIREMLSQGKNGDFYTAAYMLRWRPEAALVPPLILSMSAKKYRGTVVWQALDAVQMVVTDSQAADLLRRYEAAWRFSCLNFLIKQAREHPNHPSYTGEPLAATVVWGKIRQISEICALAAPEIFGFKNSLGMTFVPLPAGTFRMGSPADEEGRWDKEQQHQVTLSQPFYLQTTPVTQGQWQQVMGSNPSRFTEGGADCSVEQLSWDDAQEFLGRLNSLENTDSYRLPTEAEWEYACRAGSTTRYGFGDDPGELENYAWFSGNPDSQTHPVGQKQPNAWGLYDIHGNVWEWCQDWYGPYDPGPVVDPGGPVSGTGRVLRGGSWGDGAWDLRSAVRYSYLPDNRADYIGFRVARTF